MRLLAIGLGLAAISIAVRAQDKPPDWDWVLQLSRVLRHQAENFQRIPNYVCSETVDRYESKGLGRPRKLDTLHFEVAHVEHQELLALPGSKGFEKNELSSLASTGLLGTGDFSALLLNIFVEKLAHVTAHRPPSPDPAILSYDFDLPAFRNGLEIKFGGNRAVVGERGTFWVDAETLDLMQIEAEVIDPPVWTAMRELKSAVKYAPLTIGGSAVLLPQSATLTTLKWDDSELQNQVTFSGCREYVSESTVHFGDPIDSPTPPPRKK